MLSPRLRRLGNGRENFIVDSLPCRTVDDIAEVW